MAEYVETANNSATKNEPDEVVVEEWRTIAVTPMPPGWVNIFDVDGQQTAWPCPAILLQQLVSSYTLYHYPDHTVREKRIEFQEPYETRATFANSSFDSPHLEPLEHVSNYVGTDYRPDLKSGHLYTP